MNTSSSQHTVSISPQLGQHIKCNEPVFGPFVTTNSGRNPKLGGSFHKEIQNCRSSIVSRAVKKYNKPGVTIDAPM